MKLYGGNSSSVAERFESAIQKISAQSEELKKIRVRQRLVRAWLEFHGCDVIEKTLLSGSCKRNTAIRPLPPVDILVVVDLEKMNSEQAHRRILEECKKMQNDLQFQECSCQNGSICMHWSKDDGPDLEMVIVRSLGDGGFEAVNKDFQKWKRTHVNDALSRNEYWKKLIRLLKYWNNLEKVPPFKSYHLEVMCSGITEKNVWKEAENDRKRFLVLLEYVLSILDDNIEVINQSWSMVEVKSKLQHAIELVIVAVNMEGSSYLPDISHKKWKELFKDVYV